MFFVVTALLSSIGPGNIASAALVAPLAMPAAGRAGVPAFLMAIMVGNGASSGSLSPFAPTGIIVNGIMSNMGLAGYEWPTYRNNLLVHAVVAFTGYMVLGGWRLFRRSSSAPSDERADGVRLEPRHWITLAVIAALIGGVLFFEVDVGMGALVGATFLALLRLADHKEAIRKMPWAVILMVSGVTVLISLLQKTQGLDLFTSMLAGLANQNTITGVMAFVTGLISVYSSTSGVVLPAFLPTIPGLIERLGGGDPIAIASSINVGGHLVDVSPLSTIGALCIAAIGVGEDAQALFNKLLAWGLSMSVVGAVVCYVLF
jgi:di/tricarboxylate transporter